MTNVRALAESDTRHTIGGEFSGPIIMTTPEGLNVSIDKNGNPLTATIRFGQTRTTPDGETIFSPDPHILVRESILPRVPKTGERFRFKLPAGPTATIPTVSYLLDPSRSIATGRSIGVLKLYLQSTEQFTPPADPEGGEA